MRIFLVNMPWAMIDAPSLALGILRNAAVAAVPDAEVTVVHANLDYVDWVVGRHRFTTHDYHYYCIDSYFSGVGDWVFSSALYRDPQWRTGEPGEETWLTDERHELSLDLHASAPEFVEELAAGIVAAEPDVVGFTSTFQQNTAALATAQAVKRASPQVRVAFGGANCDGAQGAALHRNFPFVDYVIRGEGDVAFPALLKVLAGPELAEPTAAAADPAALAVIPGLCWRGPDGGHHANPMTGRALPPSEIVTPDYDGFFERLESSAAHDWVEPKLVVESARGCWWGQKHHCTFCGLNGSFMEFRSKNPAAFYDEIIRLVRRHKVLDMYVVDNILDMGYLTTLIPRLAESSYDLRLHYEIKSNLRRDQLRALAGAGVVSVQPGIENLSSRVLKIMDKGVSGCQNVRLLRDAYGTGLTLTWNYLYGFPGERPEDYLPLIAQFPALHHLPPPDVVTRLVIERFSPYFDRPELGFAPLEPASQYHRIYDLPNEELMDLAYMFAAPRHGIDESVADVLREAVGEWQRAYAESRFGYLDLGDSIVLVSRRARFDWTVHSLRDPVEVAAFRLLDQPRTVPGLVRELAGSVTEPEVDALLDRWCRLGIAFADAGHYVHVAAVADNQELLRIGQRLDGSSPDLFDHLPPAATSPVPAT
ncbi:RiPP maturation radical SAM C-methyltransferase [Nonomuraea sp. KM88]|uniref:RiPP maturation radical SAM C-methyltransferase n=1 Tax=Nonomuraea sp. KM88 TaxID=3457427 RepID=UPI003FCCE09D